MNNKMWFGIPGSHMQWVPAPSISSTISRNRFVEEMKFDNGGGDVRRSHQYQLRYDFNFSGPAHELDGIDVFNRFASGMYGDGLICLAHPANFETNMFPAAWASPGLAEEGWKPVSNNPVVFEDTVTNSYRQPLKTAVFNVTSDPGEHTYSTCIAVPPTHTLHVGVSGSATGTANVVARPIASNNTYLPEVFLDLLDPTLDVRMSHEFDGANVQAVEFYVSRQTLEDSTLTLVSMMAQLHRTNRPAVLPSSHIPGEGATGLEFVDDAIVETYSYMFPPHKGLSTSLVEVGAWR